MWNDLEPYQRYRVDTISTLKITKGNNYAKNVGGVTVFNLFTSSGHALYFYQVSWTYLEQYQSYRADTISILKITKENNSAKNVGGVNIVNLCMSSGHALYLCQLSWNYLERYQSYRADTISIRKITKGNNSPQNVGGVTVVNLCTLSGHALYFYQVLWNYLKRYQNYRADTISILKITKGNNSAKNVGGVTVFYLCISSGHALYFYQVLWNYLNKYQSYRADTISILKITKGNNSAKKVSGVTVLISARRLVMLYISTKFCEIISNGIKVIERTRFLYRKFQRGIIPQKCRWSNGCWSRHVVWSCFIFLPSFVKLSHTVSKL